ncbi:MAG: 30S ribosomal protein S17 [Synergistaceae bacterium]|jgi:small subunit ribosomal protein S17|nr:30S ribosomal protein S17 [Synergistaceae bacterium]
MEAAAEAKENNGLSHRKVRVGVVVSDKMNKTVVVKVSRHAEHPLYGKRIIKSKKYVAHDEENVCRIGDQIRIRETRPLSKTKRWELVEIVRKAPVFDSETPGEE